MKDAVRMRKPSSICLMATSFSYGGAEVQVGNIARTLRQRGWTVHLVSLVEPEQMGERLRAEGFEVHSLKMRRGIPDPRAIVRLLRMLRRWRPDVLHCHMVHANLLGRIARIFASVPVMISTAHNIDEGGRWREWAYRITDGLTDLTTNVSEAAVRRYVKVGAAPASRIVMMPNGVDTSLFRRDVLARRRLRKELNLGNDFVWLAIGRIVEAKDFPNMLRAFAQARENASTTLLILGTGDLDVEIQGLAVGLGLQSSARFLGTRSDVPALMSAADGYLMSSAWEGLPMVLLEAAAAGLPVVTTDVGGNAEVVHDGKTGFVCPARDSYALASAMTRMMGLSSAQRKAMGTAAREFVVKNHDIDAVVDRWEAIYQDSFDRSVSRGATSSKRGAGVEDQGSRQES